MTKLVHLVEQLETHGMTPAQLKELTDKVRYSFGVDACVYLMEVVIGQNGGHMYYLHNYKEVWNTICDLGKV